VLGRPFGLRQMAKNGKRVVLMRDMTDTMYDPSKAPFVSHFSGTDRVVAHVERYVCPTITSDQIVGGKPFRFKDDTRPRIAFLIAEDEYKTETTLPAFAARWLAKDYAIAYVFDAADDKNLLTGASAIDDADVLFVSVRRRSFPTAQLDAIRRHVASGKGVVGIRTASHAFALRGNTPPPEGHAVWPEFDAEVLGGHYVNHHKEGPKVRVENAETEHGAPPLLDGIGTFPLSGVGTLYKVRPLARSATPLLIGTIPGEAPEPVAWTNLTTSGGRVFYTSLGHADDFHNPALLKLLRNAVDWTAGRPRPLLSRSRIDGARQTGISAPRIHSLFRAVSDCDPLKIVAGSGPAHGRTRSGACEVRHRRHAS
jgi:type 1 glutamine amidotransferase